VNMGAALHALQRYPEAIEVYDRVVRLYRAELSHGKRQQIAYAFFNRAVSLKAFADARSVLVNYDRVAETFSDDPSPTLREYVVTRLYNSAQKLTVEEKYADAELIYQLIYANFSNDTALGVRKVLAQSLNNLAVGEGLSGKLPEELETNDLLAQRFAKDEDPDIRALVARALSNAADARVVEYKQGLPHADSSAQLLARAMADLQKARWICAPETCASVLGNLGYAQFLSGNATLAEQTIREAIRMGGSALVESLRNDTALHRLEPTDNQFDNLLTRLSRSR
jgi:hypothetical protein